MMVEAESSETSVHLYQTSRCHIPECSSLYRHHHDRSRYHMIT